MRTELHFLEQLSDFQLEVVKSLKTIGYKWDYSHYYSMNGFDRVDVSKIKSLQDLMIHFFKDGKNQARWEMQRALGI